MNNRSNRSNGQGPESDPHVRLAVCDARCARILRGRTEWPERIHLEDAAELRNPWIDFHEHGRPMMLGRGPSANASQHFADEHREPEELERRFARETARWLAEQAALQDGPLVGAFAATRFLGYLRAALPETGLDLPLLRGELCALRAHEVAAHPAASELMRDALLRATR